MRKKSILILTLAVVLIMALGAAGSPVLAENANLVKNPGFEQVSNNFPTDWSKSEGAASDDLIKIEVSNNAPHSGSNCLKVENDGMKDSMAIQPINLKKDKVYLISCWIRTENIVNEAGSANITIYYDNNGIDCKGIITSQEFQNTNNQWTKLEFKFRTLSLSSQLYLGVRLGGQGTVNQGIAYFDDLTLQESDDSGQVLTFFIPNAASSSNNSSAPGSSGPNKVIIYVILGIVAIGLLVFMESKLGKKGKKGEAGDEAEEEDEAVEEEDEEEEAEEEEEEESADDEIEEEKKDK